MYPIMLDLKGRSAVVVGGGAVGLRRLHALVEAGAAVTLVDPTLGADCELAGVTILHQPYQPSQLRGAALVFACTDDHLLNSRIAADARRLGVLVNAADQAADCDFHCPAVARDGEVTVAVGTAGAAAGLASRLRDLLAQALPPRVGEFAAALSALRADLKSAVSQPALRMDIMKRLSSREGYESFIQHGVAGPRGLYRKLLEGAADAPPVCGPQP